MTCYQTSQTAIYWSSDDSSVIEKKIQDGYLKYDVKYERKYLCFAILLNQRNIFVWIFGWLCQATTSYLCVIKQICLCLSKKYIFCVDIWLLAVGCKFILISKKYICVLQFLNSKKYICVDIWLDIVGCKFILVFIKAIYLCLSKRYLCAYWRDIYVLIKEIYLCLSKKY